MLKSKICGSFAVLMMLTNITWAEDGTGLVEKGAQAYRVCAACHSLKPGVHLSGPSLAGRWGKKAATVNDFGRYTAVLKNADIIWDADTLDAWLADPQAMLPGTTMTFRGVENEETRKNLIAFLKLAMDENGGARAVKQGLIPQAMSDGQIPPDLSSVGENQQIREIRHCKDAYYVTTADGAQFPFWETNVRIKIDTSTRGPKKGEPVLLRSGMAGDRISVVFSDLADIRKLIAEKC